VARVEEQVTRDADWMGFDLHEPVSFPVGRSKVRANLDGDTAAGRLVALCLPHHVYVDVVVLLAGARAVYGLAAAGVGVARMSDEAHVAN
jgi:hypothetical protein